MPELELKKSLTKTEKSLDKGLSIIRLLFHHHLKHIIAKFSQLKPETMEIGCLKVHLKLQIWTLLKWPIKLLMVQMVKCFWYQLTTILRYRKNTRNNYLMIILFFLPRSREKIIYKLISCRYVLKLTIDGAACICK